MSLHDISFPFDALMSIYPVTSPYLLTSSNILNSQLFENAIVKEISGAGLGEFDQRQLKKFEPEKEIAEIETSEPASQITFA